MRAAEPGIDPRFGEESGGERIEHASGGEVGRQRGGGRVDALHIDEARRGEPACEPRRQTVGGDIPAFRNVRVAVEQVERQPDRHAASAERGAYRIDGSGRNKNAAARFCGLTLTRSLRESASPRWGEENFVG